MTNFNLNVVQSSKTFGFSTETKENVSMKDGNASVEQVDVVNLKHQDSNEEYLAINIRMRGLDGGGCFDTVTSRTASKLVLSLDRIKYLFKSVNIEFPELSFFQYAIEGIQTEVGNIIGQAFEEYAKRGGNPQTIAELVQLDANSPKTVVFKRKQDYIDLIGDNPSVTFQYHDLQAVGTLKRTHNAKLRTIRSSSDSDATKNTNIEQAKNEYYLALANQPVVPCQIIANDINSLADAIRAIGENNSFYVKTSSNGRQVRAYEEFKA
jgi:hypothetical protein